MNRCLLSALAIVVAIPTGCMNAGGRGQSSLVGKPAPDFELTALDGAKVRLSSFKGKPILLNFWAVG